MRHENSSGKSSDDEIKNQILDAGYWILDTGYLIPDV
jgi:hypothetical protein